ncbi:hypothetical protein Pth03_09670 [Planotetraspora thailandica]|uniref:DUF402 domain-containing protein n=1 Tax=Planotetraspora thailandica TaxID=487172 RepID=A0A8J3XX73_9ACTN|nr:DUF402 domain-containing protein [Planotetraspora thailandica]GII52578.1 hypothetical protein Pth03_09670 [Planotetraspora thailandica]
MGPVRARFDVGETVVRRDVFREKTWTASPQRVLLDDGERLALACWPGAVSLAPTDWILWLRTGDPVVRKQTIHNLASGRWRLGRWIWRDTIWVSSQRTGDYYGVGQFYDPQHRLQRWYVNFQRPYRRTALGIDTFDLLLDLVVEPDLSAYRWKDEDEYTHGRRLGVISDAEHQAVERAREQVIALIDERTGPFEDTWQVDLGWPLPVLPSAQPT